MGQQVRSIKEKTSRERTLEETFCDIERFMNFEDVYIWADIIVRTKNTGFQMYDLVIWCQESQEQELKDDQYDVKCIFGG